MRSCCNYRTTLKIFFCTSTCCTLQRWSLWRKVHRQACTTFEHCQKVHCKKLLLTVQTCVQPSIFSAHQGRLKACERASNLRNTATQFYSKPYPEHPVFWSSMSMLSGCRTSWQTGYCAFSDSICVVPRADCPNLTAGRWFLTSRLACNHSPIQQVGL